MPDSTNNPLGLPYQIRKLTSQTYYITPVFQVNTPEFRKVMPLGAV